MSRSLSLGSPPVTKAWASTTERVPARRGRRGRRGPGPWRRRAPPVAGLVGAELVPDQGGFEVRQPVEGDVAVRVGQHDGGAAARRVGAQMDAGAADQPGADAEPAGRVVVAGDHHGGHARVRRAGAVRRRTARRRPAAAPPGRTRLPRRAPRPPRASRTVATRWSRKPAGRRAGSPGGSDRPRCQSDVCSNLTEVLPPARSTLPAVTPIRTTPGLPAATDIRLQRPARHARRACARGSAPAYLQHARCGRPADALR